MKNFLSASMLLGILLAACGGPKTVDYKGNSLTYNSSVWEEFSNDAGSGLKVKGDVSCWIDLKGNLTSPLASEVLTKTEDGGVTFYSDTSGVNRYISFGVGDDMLYANVSLENPESCSANLRDLAGAQ